MTEAQLKKITHTTTGYEVKNLKWLGTDNIITGQVKDPETGKPTLHDGFITGQWRKDGTPTNRIKGRTDLKLQLETQSVSVIDDWTDKVVNKVYLAIFDNDGNGKTTEQKRELLKAEQRKYEKQF